MVFAFGSLPLSVLKGTELGNVEIYKTNVTINLSDQASDTNKKLNDSEVYFSGKK
jgi:hypothetical protein